MVNILLAAEEMHPADEPASSRGISWKSTFWKAQHRAGEPETKSICRSFPEVKK